MEQAAAKAQEESKEPQSAAVSSDTQMSFDVKVRETEQQAKSEILANFGSEYRSAIVFDERSPYGINVSIALFCAFHTATAN